MDWLKRNLVLVVVAAVALGLLGFGGYSLYAKYQDDAEVTGTLQAEIDANRGLNEKAPHPNDENIKTARSDQKRIDGFLANARSAFARVSVPPNLDNALFRNLLDNAVSDLRRDAEKFGVSLEALGPKYGFTFAAQLQSVQYASNTLEPLAIQLAEIRTLVEILYHANVHSLLGLRRVPVAPTEETFGSTDYLVGKRVGTDPDTGALVTPYEVAFQCFSTELANVLEGVGRSPYCIVVKNLVVDKNLTPLSVAEGEAGSVPGGMDATLAARYGLATAAPAVPTGVSPGMDPALAQRYGLNRPGGSAAEAMRRYGGKQDGPGGGMSAAMRSRYGLGGRNPAEALPQPPPGPNIVGVAPVATPPRTGLSTVLDERPLRVTLQIEFIRFPTEGEAKRQKPAPPPPQ